jgi:hypothetical protein
MSLLPADGKVRQRRSDCIHPARPISGPPAPERLSRSRPQWSATHASRGAGRRPPTARWGKRSEWRLVQCRRYLRLGIWPAATSALATATMRLAWCSTAARSSGLGGCLSEPTMAGTPRHDDHSEMSHGYVHGQPRNRREPWHVRFRMRPARQWIVR